MIGHGIDIVQTERIAKLLEDHGERFLSRVFTPLEQQHAELNGKRRIERLAGRFAAKEAILKALGTGWRGKIAWTDMEIAALPSGQPAVRLSGECARIAAELGIARWLISISHIDTHAMASAIGLGGE
jgi:holo-[acyl-carrier protein] synthase